MTMKKVFVFIFIALCGFMFVGCTSATNLSAVNTKFTSLYFAIEVDQTQFGALSENEKIILKSNVTTSANNYIRELKTRYYQAIESYRLSNKITSNESIIYKNHLTPYLGWTDNTFLIELRFYSTTASRIFVKSAEYSGAINEELTFQTQTYEKFSKVFSQTPNNLITSSLEQYFLDSINSNSQNLDVDFYYLFATESAKLHSSNADEAVETVNGSIFCFYSNENFEEIEFEFYVVQANVLIYYLICLAIVFVFLAIYLVVIYILKFRKQQKQVE